MSERSERIEKFSTSVAYGDLRSKNDVRSIREIDISNKRVLVRVDFNVNLNENGEVEDDFRIRAALPTIKYLLGNNAKIILMSHLGKPDGKAVEGLRLGPIQDKLTEILDLSVAKADDCVGEKIEKWIAGMQTGEILLLENLRFHKGEKENDEKFAGQLARLGDIYVNDAFGTCHRNHASVSAITKFLPSYAGLLLEKEIEVLTKAIENPEKPLAVIIGGAKVSTKIKVIKKFLDIAENILLGGALANTVLHAQGLAIGKSFVEEAALEKIKDFNITDTKLHLPVDAVVSKNKSGQEEAIIEPVGKIGEDKLILDIGPETEELFGEIIKSAKTVIWNGPMGLFETEKFSRGTRMVASAIISCGCHSIVGGGETIAFINKNGWTDKFFHVSTGGGAMLKFLAGEKLPGIEALEAKNI